jgi:hypothetical protein
VRAHLLVRTTDNASELQQMITLHDWIGKQKNLLTEFEQWWQENHRRSSVQFPASLDEGDWVEQFAFFYEQRKDTP